MDQRNTLASRSLTALQAGDRAAVLGLMREGLATGMPLDALYLEVLQPALYEIGRLWEAGQIGVADEHLVTAITRSVMEQCAGSLKPVPSGPPTVITTCVGIELHDLGLRMVADCLELSGWHTLFLGCNMPLDAIVALAERHHIAVVAASITIGSHARYVRDLVNALRVSTVGSTVKILVGGQPFQRIPGLWQQVGADGTASDARAAAEWVQSHMPAVKELV